MTETGFLGAALRSRSLVLGAILTAVFVLAAVVIFCGCRMMSRRWTSRTG